MKRQLINFLNDYLRKRKSAKFYGNLIDFGYKREHIINKMINARIIKPSELQIEEELKEANDIHNYILKLLEDKEIAFLLEENKINIDNIRNLKFDKITECNAIYTVCSQIGMLGQKKLSGFYLMVGGFTVVEAFLVIIIIISIFLKIFS